MLMNKAEDAAVRAAIQRETLNDYLARWHAWSHGKSMNGTDHIADPAFRDSESYRGWETADELHDRNWLKFVLKTIDTIVTGDDRAHGAMESPYKDAILIQARNLYTGFNVWVSKRLPSDSMERTEILAEARAILLRRLRTAGVVI
jgi:hypothetical protein